jgi:hypothetical protein
MLRSERPGHVLKLPILGNRERTPTPRRAVCCGGFEPRLPDITTS